jgi:hypothetical protein
MPKAFVALLVLLLSIYLTGCVVGEPDVPQTRPTPVEQPNKEQPTHLYPVTVGGRHGFIDQAGRLVINLPEEVYTAGWFSEGLAVIARREPNTLGRWGFIDGAGAFVIKPQFHNAKPFAEGLAAVIVREQEGVGGKVGYVDRTGRIVIEPQFDTGGAESDFSFSQGLSAVPLRNNSLNGWGYIDKAGRVVIPAQFAHALPFAEDRAVAGVSVSDYSNEAKSGYIDREGRWVVEPRFSYAGSFSEGLAAVVVGEKVGYIDRQGVMVIKPQFEYGYQCPDTVGTMNTLRFSEGLAPVSVRGKWGFIDNSGRLVVKSAYDCAEPFSEGLALVGMRHGMGWHFGYIDRAGAAVVEPRFTAARAFSGGLALVGIGLTDDEMALRAMEAHEAGKSEEEIRKELEGKGMKYGYIDKSGEFVWQPTN